MQPHPQPHPSGRRLLPRGPRALAAACLLASAALLPGPAPLHAADPAPASPPETGKPAKAPKPARSSPRVVKVLPHFLDKEGRHAVNPSLFDRDAYQFELRRNPALRSGMRFDVLWKSAPGTPAALDLKLELRGTLAPEQAPVIVTARAFSRGGFSQWTRIPVLGPQYEALGELLAWRVTLWKDDQLLAEQTSFLW